MISFLEEVNGEGRTIVMVTHDPGRPSGPSGYCGWPMGRSCRANSRGVRMLLDSREGLRLGDSLTPDERRTRNGRSRRCLWSRPETSMRDFMAITKPWPTRTACGC